MPSPSILIYSPVAGEYLEAFVRRFPQLDWRATRDRDEAIAMARAVEVMLLPSTLAEDALFVDTPNLRWVQTFTAGTESVVGAPSLRAGIAVSSASGIHGPQMTEFALHAMLDHVRRMPRIRAQQQQNHWHRVIPGLLAGKRVTLVGTGVIAAEMATRFKLFGMQVTGVTRTPRELPGFDRVLTRERMAEAVGDASFIIVLLPRDAGTEGIVDAAILAAMQSDAYLIDLSRGGVIDPAALLDTLRNKRIAGAALDVFVTEPLGSESPLWQLENVTITPHLGGLCDIYVQQVVPLIAANLERYLAGGTKGLMNLVRG